MRDITVPRRSLLRLAGAGAIGTAAANMLGGCRSDTSPQSAASAPPRTSTAPDGRRKVLLAYFSRAGWNYFNGGRKFLQTGNTEVLAAMIGKLIGCDVHRIEAADPYSDDYGDTVARNVREQNADARPAIANPLASIDQYDTLLLASGIWNVRAPMIMSTFADSYDFAGKTVHPVTTYAMSGLGTTERDYGASCRGATIAAGLAVRGEEVEGAGPAVEAWLRRNSLLKP
ncbi:flavodoxin [Catellatospora sichuanensis]|uniref:flavodoxin n=1 Tax=Catellatospora sichuanensis TaxID=1969805 RepID=UPI00118465DB|nr:flavodoxin [Catellatospora sichuanensis]